MTDNTAIETLRAELGKFMIAYQSSFIEEHQLEEQYNKEISILDEKHDFDLGRIHDTRNRAIRRVAELMDLAGRSAEGQDIVFEKLASTYKPTGEVLKDTEALLKRIKSRSSVRMRDNLRSAMGQ